MSKQNLVKKEKTNIFFVIAAVVLIAGGIFWWNGPKKDDSLKQEPKKEDKVIAEDGSKTINQPPVVKEIVVVASEFSFSPSSIAVKQGESVRLIFKNEGETTHNLTIQGLNKQTNTIGGGQIDVLEFTAPTSGIYDFICSVSDHRARGMTGKFIAQ